MRKVILAIMVLILGCSFAFPQKTTVVTKTEMYVYAKDNIILRVEPKQNAKKTRYNFKLRMAPEYNKQ
ncbi:hypothetical protein [Sporosarcina koreensis]|uniref:Iron Transport-associated domain-containing protein n=1 Tax=Sporosarcina koreensis TaxID=334735 RepID=A0ABW0TXS5_9BACL